ncbi:C-GCAxxG-C-C family protein [Chloroflexota bacterium]
MSVEGVSVQKAKEMSQEERELLLSKIEQHAHDYEVKYWGCSQAVLYTLQQDLQLSDGGAFKAASPFAGGVARMREVCGALLGGVMAIGLVYGRTEFEAGKVALEQPDCVESMVRASKFGERFKEKFGCLRCGDVQAVIHGPDFKPHVRFTVKSFEEHAKCGEVTGPAARLAAEIILAPREQFIADINVFLDDFSQVRKEQRELGLV